MTQLPVNPSPPAWCTSPVVMRALTFASHAHRAQVRKYTGEPYIYHPMQVASILVEVLGEFATDDMLCAALLHDTVEDCEVTFTELRREFGDTIAVMVMHLTDLVSKDYGNRETRKMMECERLRCAPFDCQLVKLADFISNTESITTHDPDFARVYLSEKARCVETIRTAWFRSAPQMSRGHTASYRATALFARAQANVAL